MDGVGIEMCLVHFPSQMINVGLEGHVFPCWSYQTLSRLICFIHIQHIILFECLFACGCWPMLDFVPGLWAIWIIEIG